MNKYDNLNDAIKAEFIRKGYTMSEAIESLLRIWRDWDKKNAEDKAKSNYPLIEEII